MPSKTPIILTNRNKGMAVRRGSSHPKNQVDKLADTLSGIITDNRLTNWLWFFIYSHYPQANLGDFGSPAMRNRMAEVINQNPSQAKSIEEQSKILLLPDRDLQWITNNKRQNMYLIHKLAGYNGNNYAPHLKNLTLREVTIFTIDCWPIDTDQKLQLLNQIKQEWENHTNKDYLFKWFDGPEEKEKSELAFELIPKKYLPPPPGTNPFQGREDVLIYFDRQCLSASDKELFVIFVKKRWSQNKYRAKMTGKKQYNFILSDKAINRLDKLAQKHDLKRTQVLEILLQMEDQKGIYIPERLKILMDT